MNAEHLLAHFERISEAPDAISRLRRFILDLAVRGKLVEDYPDESTPAQTLDELRKNKNLACAVEGLRARKPITPIQPSELWFDFPHRWMLCSFDDVLVIVSGVTKGQRIPSSEPSVNIPYLRVANVQRGWLDLSEVKSITVRASDVDRYRLTNQDILMTEGGDWDKLGRAAIWRGEIASCIHQNHIFRLRIPSSGILPEWVVLYANSDCGRKFFEDASKQTTNLASINLTQLRSCPIPLPPLAEQHRIVAKVDELMSLCDQLEACRLEREQGRERLVAATLQRLNRPAEDPVSFRQDASLALHVLPSLTTTPGHSKQLRQTILNLAVRGKLVEQDPGDEPAEELLGRIAEARFSHVRSGKRKKQNQINDESMDDPFELPDSWQWVRFTDVVDFSCGRTPARSEDKFWKTGYYNWVSIGDMEDGKPLHATREKVSQLAGEAVFRSEPKPIGTMIMSFKLTIGKMARLAVPAFHNEAIISIHPYLEELDPYLFKVIPIFAKTADSKGAIKGATLNRDSISRIQIPLPPLAEQHRIVAKVDELMSLCDQLEEQLSQADQQRRRLLEAVLDQALAPMPAES